MSDLVTNYWIRLSERIPDFEAAPVSSFLHVPLSYNFDEYVRIGVLVEVAHLTTRNERKVAYWPARIQRKKGYFIQLRWLGADNDSSGDFWRNSAWSREPSSDEFDPRIHPVGYAMRMGASFQPPDRLQSSRGDWTNYLREELRNADSLLADYHDILEEENRCSFREGHMVEATYLNQRSAMKRAVVVGVIGRRIRFRYVDDRGIEEYCWFHEFSEMFQYCGWSRLHGRQLIPDRRFGRDPAGEPANEPPVRVGFDEPPNGREASLFDFKPLLLPRSVAEALERLPFNIGDELLFIDPRSPGLRVGIVSRILRNNWLMVQAVSDTAADDTEPFCLHAGSERILWPGFAADWDVEEHVRPRDFRFRNPNRLPREIFERTIPRHGFRAGQFLEVSSPCGTDRVSAARVRRVVSHLLLIGIIGHPTSEDQFFPMTSPDIYNVGWTHANKHPLTAPLI